MAREGGLELALEALSEGSVVVRVVGELDLATVPELEQLLTGVDPSGLLVIDLSGCTFLDSSALRLLIETIKNARQRGGEVSLVVSDSGVMRVLEIAGVPTMATVHPTIDAAL